MSKPIKVAVVVIVEKKIRGNHFLVQKNPCPKTLGQKVLDPKRMWVQKSFNPKKNFVHKIKDENN